MTAPWHSTLLDALREAFVAGWTHAAEDGQPAAKLSVLVMELPAHYGGGAYQLMGNRILDARGQVRVRLTREGEGPPGPCAIC